MPPLLSEDFSGATYHENALSTEGGERNESSKLLNTILPPSTFTDESGKWLQYVSPDHASRAAVRRLQDLLELRLEQRQARPTGICPVREDLASQAFDELIRQVTVNCPERGLLLLRVRDEIRMRICAYQTLYKTRCAIDLRGGGIMALSDRSSLIQSSRQHAPVSLFLASCTV